MTQELQAQVAAEFVNKAKFHILRYEDEVKESLKETIRRAGVYHGFMED